MGYTTDFSGGFEINKALDKAEKDMKDLEEKLGKEALKDLDKQDLKFLDEIDNDDPFYEYFLEYESELHRNNAVDFGGLITGVLNLSVMTMS